MTGVSSMKLMKFRIKKIMDPIANEKKITN